MKKLKIELRMYFAEKLLGLAFKVAPWNEEGQNLRKHIADYYWEMLEEFKRKNEK